jgi:hypothetical protein
MPKFWRRADNVIVFPSVSCSPYVPLQPLATHLMVQPFADVNAASSRAAAMRRRYGAKAARVTYFNLAQVPQRPQVTLGPSREGGRANMGNVRQYHDRNVLTNLAE